LRPHRDSGFVVSADRLDDKLLVHDYGHGGTGFSLGRGTGLLATGLALAGSARRAAVIGSGAVGLMAARQLQRHGFDVTIYAAPGDASGALAVFRDNAGADLMPPGMSLPRELLEPGVHPVSAPYASVAPTLRFEPSIYFAAMLRDVVLFGGKIVVRKFDSPRDLAQLAEPVVVNCTGLGAKALFGDNEPTPVKGQLVVLVPPPELRYAVAGTMPRSDGVVLGHVAQAGVWDTSVDDAERKRVVERAIQFFGTMRAR
jgi:hypothetical protein